MWLFQPLPAAGQTDGAGTLKTFNGLVVSAIKTFNGLAIASTKTVDGLTP